MTRIYLITYDLAWDFIKGKWVQHEKKMLGGPDAQTTIDELRTACLKEAWEGQDGHRYACQGFRLKSVVIQAEVDN